MEKTTSQQRASEAALPSQTCMERDREQVTLRSHRDSAALPAMPLLPLPSTDVAEGLWSGTASCMLPPGSARGKATAAGAETHPGVFLTLKTLRCPGGLQHLAVVPLTATLQPRRLLPAQLEGKASTEAGAAAPKAPLGRQSPPAGGWALRGYAATVPQATMLALPSRLRPRPG